MNIPAEPPKPAPFSIDTFEGFTTHRPRQPYGERAAEGVPFPIHDPFGLRRAIVPVFQRGIDGTVLGVGTAFHVDGWGRLLTADHVIEHTRNLHRKKLQPNALLELNIEESPHVAILLGYGMLWGTHVLPDECWTPICRIDFIVQRHDDPMASLRGESAYRVHDDIAGMQAHLHPLAPAFHALAVNFRWKPQIGERVFAVGYPELDVVAMSSEQIRDLLQEGMFGVYGRITNHFPKGRDRGRSTPVFEVEGDFRPGMSGGPVFNEYGHVVGVVSYSLPPSEDSPGVGYATSLHAIPDAPALAPTLDPDNPGYRRGYGIYTESPWHLAEVAQTRREAKLRRTDLGRNYQIRSGSHRLGSDDFVPFADRANCFENDLA